MLLMVAMASEVVMLSNGCYDDFRVKKVSVSERKSKTKAIKRLFNAGALIGYSRDNSFNSYFQVCTQKVLFPIYFFSF
jgi:hypothetical protein